MNLAETINHQINNIRNYGLIYELLKVKRILTGKLHCKTFYKKIVITEEERKIQKNKKYSKKIVFDILVPLYNTPEKFLREMIESVQNQTYGDWKLCLADGSDEEHDYVGKVVREYSSKESRIKYKVLKENGGISENTNECLRMSDGEYIVLFDHDDILHESALFELRKAVDEKAADFIYTDEAIFSKDYHKPDNYHLKPDFAIDDIRSNNFICHITCFSRGLLEKTGEFRKEFDGSQDFDMVLRLTEKAKNIVHIPKVLYYWRCHEASVASDISAKTYCIDAGQAAIKAHLERIGVRADVRSSEVYPVIYRVTYEVQDEPKVSVILTKKYNECDECIESLKNNTSYTNYEVLNCEDASKRNEIAKKASGEYLLFINDGCRFYKKDWMTELLSIAQREGIGAVGGKNIYYNGRLRDAGITLGVGKLCGVSSDFYKTDKEDTGYNGNLFYTRKSTAVDDCNMMISKEVFTNVGGFDIELSEWFAGIDLCLRLKQKKYYNAVNPYAEVKYMHLEKKRDINGCFVNKKEDINILTDRWGEELNCDDSCYNVNLTRKTSYWMIG